MRNVKSYRSHFATAQAVNRERFKEAIRQGGKDVFNDKVFDAADRRRSDIGKLQQTIFFLQVPVFIYLILLVSDTDVNLTLFGITATKNLREALIVVSAGLGLWSAWLNHQADVIESLLRAKNERAAKGKVDVLEALNIAYGLEVLTVPRPTNKNVAHSGLQIAAMIIFALSVVLLIVLFAATVASVHYATLLDIYRHPNFGPLFTFIVVAFVVLADTMAFSWLAFQSGIVPYRNRDALMRMAELYETNPKRAQEIVHQMVKSHLAKGWLRRTFTRPTLPSK